MNDRYLNLCETFLNNVIVDIIRKEIIPYNLKNYHFGA